MDRLVEMATCQGWRCHLCGEPMTHPRKEKGSPLRATRDHLIPRSHGGTSAPWNLKAAHAICNTKRGNSPLPAEMIPVPPPLLPARELAAKRKRSKYAAAVVGHVDLPPELADADIVKIGRGMIVRRPRAQPAATS